MSARLPYRQGKAEQGCEISPSPAASATSYLGQEVWCDPGWCNQKRELWSMTQTPRFSHYTKGWCHCHISQAAEGLTRPSRAFLPQMWGEQPPRGFSKQGANTDQQKGFLCECSQPLPKLLQAEYSRPAVTFGLLHVYCTIPVFFGNYMVMDS